MNTRNAHILKTWLAKAAGDISERHPCLTYIYAYQDNGKWMMVAADGFHMHLSHHFPALLKADAEKDGDAYVIELPDSVTDDKGVSKWAEKLAFNVATVAKPVLEGKVAECRVNPAKLMQVVKWIHNHDNWRFEGSAAVALSNKGLNLEVWGRKHISVLPTQQTGSFEMMVSSRFLMDALWIHYYKPQVSLYVDKTNTVLGVGDPQGNFAVVMAMGGGIMKRPGQMRVTLETVGDDDDSEEWEL